MEKDRTIIAIVLSILVILVYFQFFGPKPKPAQQPPAPGPVRPEPRPETPENTPKPVEKPVPEVEPTVSEAPEEPAEPLEQGSVRTGTIDVAWSNAAAALREVTLTAKKDGVYVYPDNTRENPLRVLYSEDNQDYILRVCRPDSVEDIAGGNWRMVERSDSELVMEARISDSLVMTKRFVFAADAYHVRLEITLKNTGDAPVAALYGLLVSNGILDEGSGRVSSASVLARQVGNSFDVKRDYVSGLTDEAPAITYTAGGVWAGLENKYFAAVVAPEDEPTRSAIGSVTVERVSKPPAQAPPCDLANPGLLNMRVILKTSEIVVQPGEESSRTHKYLFYVGPKQDDVLERPEYAPYKFDRLLDYGMFGSLSKLFLWILRGAYYVIPNWGIAVIILTLIVRACLHPVSRSSQTKMQKYQRAISRLKPKMDKLREKHKNNRQKLNAEMLKLYKEEGVSIFPAGGCLLMLLQIPVFIGLYWALSLSIELRQASFVFWINDLSQPDAAFTLSGNIPILGTPYINILPIFMLVAMIFQQKTQPRAADPQQASQQKTTMYIMLVVIGFIFYSMPSGLVLYFLTSTLVGIGETRLIKRKLAAEEGGA
jgi:YidC/Oxa1 family membrane protein insertase